MSIDLVIDSRLHIFLIYKCIIILSSQLNIKIDPKNEIFGEFSQQNTENIIKQINDVLNSILIEVYKNQYQKTHKT